MSLEQEVYEVWGNRDPWHESMWMTVSGATADWNNYVKGATLTDKMKYKMSYDYVVKTVELIKANIDIALLSPSVYVRHIAESLRKKQNEES